MRVVTFLLPCLVASLAGCVKQPERGPSEVSASPRGDRSTSGEATSPPAGPQPAAPAARPQAGCPLGPIIASLTDEPTRSGAAFVFVTDDDALSSLRERVARMSEAYARGAQPTVTAHLDRVHDGIRLVVVPTRPEDAPTVRRHVHMRAARLFATCPQLRPLTLAGGMVTSSPTTDAHQSVPSPRGDDEATTADSPPTDLPRSDDDIEPDEPDPDEPEDPDADPDEPEDPEPDPDELEDPEPDPDEPEDPEDEPEVPDDPMPDDTAGGPHPV